ncbi:hypothetical protein QZH41_017341, partial [Actinostola sp. cb2023]
MSTSRVVHVFSIIPGLIKELSKKCPKVSFQEIAVPKTQEFDDKGPLSSFRSRNVEFGIEFGFELRLWMCLPTTYNCMIKANEWTLLLMLKKVTNSYGLQRISKIIAILP